MARVQNLHSADEILRAYLEADREQRDAMLSELRKVSDQVHALELKAERQHGEVMMRIEANHHQVSEALRRIEQLEEAAAICKAAELSSERGKLGALWKGAIAMLAALVAGLLIRHFTK